MPFPPPAVPASLTIGNISAGHEVLDANGVRFYGPDGVTVLFEFDTATGDVTMDGGTIIGADFDGGTITGGTVQTAASGTRLVMSSTADDRLTAYYLGVLKGFLIADAGGFLLASPDENSYFEIANGFALINATTEASITAPTVALNGTVEINGTPYTAPPNVKGGTISGTTDGSGHIAFSHGLGSTPSSVVAITRLGDTFLARAYAISSTTATLEIRRTDGTLVVGVGVNFFWMAIS